MLYRRPPLKSLSLSALLLADRVIYLKNTKMRDE